MKDMHHGAVHKCTFQNNGLVFRFWLLFLWEGNRPIVKLMGLMAGRQADW